MEAVPMSFRHHAPLVVTVVVKSELRARMESLQKRLVCGYLPVPLRAACCGLLGALSKNCSVSVLTPLLSGVNLSLTMHDDLLGSALPGAQVADAIAKSVPRVSLAELTVAIILP
jgi:hypothetical protein